MSRYFNNHVWIMHLSLWAIGCAVLWFSWTGFVSSDDEYYVSSGLGWLHHFPFVAPGFGEIRAAVGIPMALSFGLLGESEFSAVLSTILFYLGTLSLTLHLLSRVLPYGAAFVAAGTLATVPLLAIHSTIPNADLPELFFVAVSFTLFWTACQRPHPWRLLILAGISAALAFSAHEVSLGLLVFYGLLFVIGYGIPRRQYWVMAIGFISMIGIECLYYLVLTGNALYRFTLLTKGAALRDRDDVGFLEFTPSGTLHIWAPLDPVVMFFTHVHQFALIGFLVIPALWWAFSRANEQPTAGRNLARLLAALGLVWLFFAAFALTNQKLLPRYYIVSAYCFVLTIAIWAAEEIWRHHQKMVLAGVACFVLVGISGIYMSNTNPRFGERTLVTLLQTTTEAVYTDPMTAEKIEWYCRWTKTDCGGINGRPPPPGSVYFYNPKNAERPNRLIKHNEIRLYNPKPGWKEVWRSEEPRNWLASMIIDSGLGSLMPSHIVKKLERTNPPVVLYKVGD